jgi:pimeloyl-ACP methyl ester carboxylesterase
VTGDKARNAAMNKQIFRTSDGIEIAYYVDDFTDPWTQPETLLMLHPAMSSARRYYSMVPGLARRFRVVRVDTRGHGASQIPPSSLPVNKERLTQDALELLDYLRVDAPHVLGASAGGYVGQQLAIHHPHRVKSLALFCATPGFKGEQGKRWLRDAAQRGMRAAFGETINDRLPVGEADPQLIAWVLDEICKNDLDFLARFVGYWTDTEFMDELSAIKCPTLIVAPGAEPIGAISIYDEMIKRIRGAELVVYENARHNVYDYLPDRCVADVLKFLARHFPTA